MRSLVIPVAALAFLAVACSGSDGDSTPDTQEDVAATNETPATEPPATEPPAPEPPASEPAATDVPATEPPATEPPATDVPTIDAGTGDPSTLVEQLASDELNGRNNGTDGSTAARELLLSELVDVLEPARPDAAGDDGFLQPYDEGTNIIGLLPGRGDLADEYVLIGAHYDHLGPGECDDRGVTDDEICNGAADNAAGVAAVVSIIETVDAAYIQESSDGDESDRRSIIVGLWDGEEDGLVGSEVYVGDPLIPLEQTVAYVNFDIQGAQLTPELANTTILVGPETGGEALVDAAGRATDASTLDYATLSLIFGQGRSDHASLVAGGVPSVFFTDANNGCYHTVLDDVDHVDDDKLDLQIATAQTLVDDLLTTQTPPTFVSDTPLTTYDDAVAMLDVVARAEPDFAILAGDGPATSAQFLVDLHAIVDAGAAAYDDAASGAILGGSAALIDGLANSECTLPV
ncbi:M28 family peptidase [Ilumatobacter sp.]|uniref:M28 family peptidase n=1 Tax=Ilumatobacter sp. TaxID=1967498 RepID=UPI003C6BA546